MLKDTLQPDILFQIQLCKVKNLCSQLFITVPSLETIAAQSVAQETWGVSPNLWHFISWITSSHT